MVTDYRIQVTDYWLQIVGYRLQVTGYRVRVMGSGTEFRLRIRSLFRSQIEGYISGSDLSWG